MARSPRSQKKGANVERATAASYREAINALEGVGANKQEFGRLNKDGTVNIDPEKIEDLKQKLGAAAWRRVRFVALNAPFKRRTSISSV
jgi:hypothetical protein